MLVVFLISGAATLYGKKIRQIIFEKPQNKTVRFLVFAGTDYSAPIYKKEKATVSLTISRLTNGKEEIVWQEVLDKGSVRNFPNYSNAMYREVCVHNVFDNRETLVAYYTVSYASRKSQMSYVQGEALPQGSALDTLQVKI
ncbi:hypothetical protein SAE01_02980 [Segetibacter aerophilus]|uniref:Uncharacterized protein n=2 Tax=Segetibacter aerophilus TaxID=670293 RepID=A0A512B768_9BACT|nr:hypothetical protein SAE01_02980 [Segetibacter aerophilus]